METSLLDKVPPHNIEAEQAVLGALLLDWTAMAEVVTYLKAEKFYSLQNQVIYAAMLNLFNKNIQGDTVSLINELNVEGNLDKAGGAAYVASLTDVTPTAANIETYAEIVMDRAMRRDLIKTSGEIRASAFELQTESSTLLDKAEQKIFSLAERSDTTEIHEVKNIMINGVELIQQRYESKGSFTGIPSGFYALDNFTSGFQDSEFIVIGARPSIGKTAIALSMMQHIALTEKIPCGFFSLEMPCESIGLRLLSQEARIPMYKLRTGMIKLEEVKKIQVAAAKWYDSPLYIVDTPNMRLLEIKAMSRRLVVNQGVKIIFIDYLGLITTDNPTAPVYEQVSEISKSLKALARELQIPIVALCQVARSAEGEEPNLAQLRGSGSIEQDADVVMFLHRDRLKEETAIQEAKIILAKQRNGATGDIPIMFLPALSKFENKAKEDKS